MEPLDHGKMLRKYVDQENRFTPEYGDYIELLGDRWTDKGPCTGRVTNVGGSDVCIKHHDEFFWLPKDRIEVIRTSLKKGKVLWIVK